MTARRTTAKQGTEAQTSAVPVLKYTLDKDAYPPERAHATDAGLDIRNRERARVVPAKGSAVFHTGIHVQIPHGYAGLFVSKSGLNVTHDVTSTGIVDEGYVGELVVKLYNDGFNGKIIEKGDKITQLVLIPVLYAQPVQADSLESGSAARMVSEAPVSDNKRASYYHLRF